MAKSKKDDSKKPLSDEETLRERVHAMLDPLRPDTAPKAPEAPSAPVPADQEPAPPPLNIFESIGTAPEVPSKLLKENGLSKKGAQSDKAVKPVADKPEPASAP